MVEAVTRNAGHSSLTQKALTEDNFRDCFPRMFLIPCVSITLEFKDLCVGGRMGGGYNFVSKRKPVNCSQ